MRLIGLALAAIAASAAGAVAQTSDLTPGAIFRDCPDCPEMVVIPAGQFVMGAPNTEAQRDDNEGPQHAVTVVRPFATSKFEVTRGQFAAFVKDTGYAAGNNCSMWTGTKIEQIEGSGWRNPNFDQNDLHPAVCITWNDAKAYVAWLKRKTGQPYRLLSEAEWEYVARAGSTAIYEFGDRDEDLCRHGNVFDLSAKDAGGIGQRVSVACRDGFGTATAPVGSFPANPFGVHDMVGNGWEWVEDCYNDSYAGAPTDGSAWTSGDCTNRVVRGGGWDSIPKGVRSANRDRLATGAHNSVLVLRLARSL